MVFSTNTLRARLERMDYKRLRARRKPFLDDRKKAMRLEYAQEHLQTNWDEVSSLQSLACRADCRLASPTSP
jgi:hypothetical protein